MSAVFFFCSFIFRQDLSETLASQETGMASDVTEDNVNPLFEDTMAHHLAI